MKIFHLIFLALFLHLTGSNGDERSALLDVKSELIDPLNALADWTAGGGPHCNWTGVQCSADGVVDGLDVSSLNLTGAMSVAAFQGLPNLRRLNLCCNSFSGALPKSIPVLPELRELDISDNEFGGFFPTGIGSFPNLITLNVSGNNFAGKLPADVGNATVLKILDFRGGFFTGSIPRSLKSLQKLEFLGLSGNNLTGELPPELGQLASLETLIIGYNGFEGNIPAEFGNLTNLRYLDMAVGNLAGPVPPELGKLAELSTFYLYKNNLEGEIPREIGNISSLVAFDISDNLIFGEIPPEFAQLANLQLLNLMCNKLKGRIPASIGHLPKLRVLQLWNNSLAGPLPENLGRTSPLEWLDVSSNSLSGVVPPGLCFSRNLTKLILFNNEFAGNIPPGISSCPSLVRVRVHNNQLNGTVPAEFALLRRLQRLELAGNKFSGAVPQDFSISTSLSFIDLSANRLQLSLPANILSIPTLQTFLASENELAGGIPDDVQGCSALGMLDLSGNHLSGAIPASLVSCRRLVNLNLRHNQLSGEIPAAIATMPTLAILDLSSNSLSGSIPASFGSSPALEMLNVSYNNLSGEVPANGMLQTISPGDLSGNPELCGGVLPPCACDDPSSPPASLRSSHIKHVVVGWLVSMSAVLAAVTGVLLARRLYARWNDVAGFCHDHFNGNRYGPYPWRLTGFQRLSFTSADVLACIKESNVVGMGATGVVYKAEMPRHNAVVAVKKLWRSDNAAAAVELIGEVNLLGRLRHRNIVRTLGYLDNDADTMILYDFMPNGSLWEALHGGASTRGAAGVLVDWVSRYIVAAGVAQGLAYLHHDCRPPVIHRDVKSGNILLDANLEARIADFGLAKMMLRKDETASAIAGSCGYIAPEYAYTMKVDEKSDIYSFGVVLMELVTGKRPVEAEFGEGEDVVGWVRARIRSNQPEEALDRTVWGQSSHVRNEMLLMLRIAVICTARSPRDRPTMRDVLTMMAEAKPCRKSSGDGGGKEMRPVFTPAPPDSDFI